MMPRNVRNFWIELDVDGKKSSIASGPRSADGGFSMTILMREDGTISDKRMEITGNVVNGFLSLRVNTKDPEGVQSITMDTER